MFVTLRAPQSEEEEGHLSGPAEALSQTCGQSVTPLTSAPFIHPQRKLAMPKASVPPSSATVAPIITQDVQSAKCFIFVKKEKSCVGLIKQLSFRGHPYAFV